MSDSVRPHRRLPTRLPRPWDSPGKNTALGCHFLLQRTKVKSQSEVTQLCPTLRNPMDCSLPGSSVHGIFQARVLEWGAIAFSFKMARALQMKTTIPLKAVNSILLLRAQEVTTPYLISYGLGLLTVWLQVSILSLMAHYIRIFINSTFKKTNPSQISLFHVCICFCWDLTDCKQ